MGGYLSTDNQGDLLAFNEDGPAHQARVIF